jgi:6-phosphogluconolactonase (cycloisomerase 2 family)
VLPYALRSAAASPRHKPFIGTGTGHSSSSKGIYVADWNKNGEVGQVSLAAELDSPTFLVLDRHVYAINEVQEGRVTAFSIGQNKDHTLKLDRLGEQTANGNDPAHAFINVDGGSVFVSNYGSGSLTSHKMEQFYRNRRWDYNANELNSTVDHLVWNSKEGTLTSHGTPISTLPDGYPTGTSSASEIIASPDRRFIYVGNRGNETIAKFDVNASSGELTRSQLVPHGGKTAGHFALEPTGRFLLVACQDSGGIVVLPCGPASGRLSNPFNIYPIASPQCLVFTS